MKYGVRRAYIVTDKCWLPPNGFQGTQVPLGMTLSKKQNQSTGDLNRAVGLTGDARVMFFMDGFFEDGPREACSHRFGDRRAAG